MQYTLNKGLQIFNIIFNYKLSQIPYSIGSVLLWLYSYFLPSSVARSLDFSTALMSVDLER